MARLRRLAGLARAGGIGARGAGFGGGGPAAARGRLAATATLRRELCSSTTTTTTTAPPSAASTGSSASSATRSKRREEPRLDESVFSLEERILGTRRAFPEGEGEVVNVSRGVVSVLGLDGARADSVVELGDQGLRGYVLRLEDRATKVAALGSASANNVRIGAAARLLTGDQQRLRAPYLQPGQVSSPIGGEYWTQENLPAELDINLGPKQGAPNFTERTVVKEQLWTGILALDALYPLGLGTRSALMSKNPAGMRHIANDILARQAKLDPAERQVDFVLWLSAGQDQSGIRKTYLDLEDTGALGFTAMVTAPASEPWALQALGPAAVCAMAEARSARGENVLVIIDSLGPVGAALAEVEAAQTGTRVTPLFQPHRYLERLGALRSGGSVTTLALLHQDDSGESDQVRDRIAGQVDTMIDMQGLRGIRAVGAHLPGIRAYQAPAMRELAWRLQVRLTEAASVETASTVARRLGIDPMDEENLGAGLAHALNLRALLEANVSDATLDSRAAELLALYIAAEGFLEAPSLTNAKQVLPVIADVCAKAKAAGLLERLDAEVFAPSKKLVSDCPDLCQALDSLIFDSLCK